MKGGYNRWICYIVTAFLLIVGMCQSRIEADFCFALEANGQMAPFLDSEEGEVSTYEISAGESLRFQEMIFGARESRSEGKRSFSRFPAQLLQAVITLSFLSFFQRTVEGQAWEEYSCTYTIIHYLHQKDGKK